MAGPLVVGPLALVGLVGPESADGIQSFVVGAKPGGL